MSEVKARGKRIVKYSCDSYSVSEFKSPGVTFPCEKVLNKPEELAKLSGEVITYKRGDMKG